MPLKVQITGLLKFILFLGLGILITWLSLRNLTPSDRAELADSFSSVKPFWIVVVLVIGVFSHLFRALRWQMLIEPVAVKPSLRNTFLAVMTGYFANLAFPRLGEVTRCGVLHTTDKIPVNRSLGTVITERGIDLILFAALFFIMMALQYSLLISYIEIKVFAGFEEKFESVSRGWIVIALILLLISLALIILFVIIRSKSENRFLSRAKSILLGFRDGVISIARIRHPWLFVFYSIMIWVCYYLMALLCFRALESTAHLGADAGLAVLVLGSVGVMITPGGIGLFPVIVRETLEIYGTEPTTGFAMGWILWTSQTAVIIITGIGSLLWLSTIRRKADARKKD